MRVVASISTRHQVQFRNLVNRELEMADNTHQPDSTAGNKIRLTVNKLCRMLHYYGQNQIIKQTVRV